MTVSGAAGLCIVALPFLTAASGAQSEDQPLLVVSGRLATNHGCCQLYAVYGDGSGRWLALRGRSPTWSPTKRQLAYVRSRRLWIGSIDGREQQVPLGQYQASDPTWAPDGERIAFACGIGDRRRDSNRGLCVVTVASGRLHRAVWFTDPHRSVYGPSWSPKRDLIAFTREPLSQIYTVRPDGRKRRSITAVWTQAKPQWSRLPRWTRHGARISYVHEELHVHEEPRDKCAVLWMRPDGSGKEAVPKLRLSRPCSSITEMSWSADGRSVAYAVLGKYCYLATTTKTPSVSLIRKPTIGCAGLTWIRQ